MDPVVVFAQLLTRLGVTFDAAGIPYMVIGGQAVLIHGEPRLTRDIDVTVGVGLEATDRVLAALDASGFSLLPEDPVAFARQTMVLPALDPASGIRVDVILSFTEFESKAIARATSVSMGGGSVRVATAEDLVVLKIIAGRPRDLEDVRSVLVRNPDIDHHYVSRWLRRFEAVSEAPESPVTVFERIRRSAGQG